MIRNKGLNDAILTKRATHGEDNLKTRRTQGEAYVKEGENSIITM
jgi:hypothetical protein